jgi:hypothetical protein
MWLCGEHTVAYSMYLTKFRTYTIVLAPQTKPRRGGGLRHLPPSPFTGKFLRKAAISGLVSLSIFVHALNEQS